MARKNDNNAKIGTPRKSLVSKREEINNLIVQSRTDPFEGPNASLSPAQGAHAVLRFPLGHSSSSSSVITKTIRSRQAVRFSRTCAQPVQPESIVAQKPECKLMDRRHEHPDVVLIRLPDEPNAPRHLHFEPKGQFSFLDLPGELRNKIYDLVIQGDGYSIEWIGNNHKTKSLTYKLSKYPTPAGPFRRLTAKDAQRRRLLDHQYHKSSTRLPSDYYNRKLPTAMLLVNNQMHHEAASVFYAKSHFRFHGIHAADQFLNHLTPVATESITRLSLTNRAYGHPHQTADQIWKHKYDRAWTRFCWRITDDCPALATISLDLTLNKSPLAFCALGAIEAAGLGAHWMRPLRAFVEIGLRRLFLRVRCPVRDAAVLEVESWKLRREILGEEWDEGVEGGRDGYGRDRKVGEGSRGPVGTMRLLDGGVVEMV